MKKSNKEEWRDRDFLFAQLNARVFAEGLVYHGLRNKPRSIQISHMEGKHFHFLKFSAMVCGNEISKEISCKNWVLAEQSFLEAWKKISFKTILARFPELRQKQPRPIKLRK
jgi:hypothetical protein